MARTRVTGSVARTKRLLAAVAATAIGLAGGVSVALAAGPASAATVYNVKNYGAKGNGSNNDSSAINKAISAANSAGGGTVEFPSGTYLAANSIHLKSNVTIQLDSGSTILGASGTGYDHAESNPYDAYQDYGHSHFHDSLIWGENVSNVAFTGSGSIDGGGHLIHGNPSSGQADKALTLVNCTNLTLNGITIKRGGHFAVLDNNCDGVKSDHFTISTASDRDGWDLMSTRHVTITNITIASNDDALAFKSDWALGKTLTSGDVTVTGAHLSAKCCNALMFGSETCGVFNNYNFSHITVTGAGKSGLGMVSMDGAKISNVTYSDVTMSGTQSPIMEKIGTRERCGDHPGIGSISHIHYINVTGTNAGAYSPTIWGQSGHPVGPDITFNNVNLTVPGGKGTMSTGVPSDNGDYNPNSIGTRPAYGWYLHYATGVSYSASSVRFSSNDGRPAVIANNSSAISFDHFTAQRGSSSPYDIGFQTVSGYCVTNSTNTSGGSLRINTSSSSKSSGCGSTGGGGGVAISSLSVKDSANAGNWSVQSNLQDGNTLYGDRSYTVASIPSGLAGSAWVRTANASRASTANPLATFSINQSATVDVGVDTRLATKPSWLGSWTDTGTQLTDTEGSSTRHFELYSKTFSAGSVALGPDGDTANSASMYVVLVH